MAKGDKKPVVMTGDIDSTVAKKIHAEQHKLGGSDPLNAADIGAASAYMMTGELPGVTGNSTTDRIFQRMGGGRAVSFYDNAESEESEGVPHLTDAPGTARTIAAWMGHGNFGLALCQDYEGNLYRYNYVNSSAVPGATSGWKEIATTDKVFDKISAITSADIRFAVAKDLYALSASCTMAYDGTTQNTPYKAGVTTYTSGICHVFVGTSYRTVVCVSANGDIFVNTYNGASWGGWKRMYGEQNKPSGNYTGTGSATTRQFNIGGSGDFLAFTYETGIAIVGGGGAIYTDGTTITCSDKDAFVNGLLTIQPGSKLNASGVTYWYHVL